MVFCNSVSVNHDSTYEKVTILILIDGFLQLCGMKPFDTQYSCHNPYFNRWFSAILTVDCLINELLNCHNPYFNRWFSAIDSEYGIYEPTQQVTILILIDGFLQCPI